MGVINVSPGRWVLRGQGEDRTPGDRRYGNGEEGKKRGEKKVQQVIMRSTMQFSKCAEAVEEHDERQKADGLKEMQENNNILPFCQRGLCVLQKELRRQLSNPTARGPSASRLLL